MDVPLPSTMGRRYILEVKRDMTLPFKRLKDHVVGFKRDRKNGVARACVRLDFKDEDTDRGHARWLEIALSCTSDMPRWQVKRAIRHGAWQALVDFYNGHDMVDENLFLENGISDAEERSLYKDLQNIQLAENPVPLHGHLMRWLLPHEVPQEFSQLVQVAA